MTSIHLSTGQRPGHRIIADIAHEIAADWKKPYFGAVPYLAAMHQLLSVDNMFGADTAKSVILSFLANAQTWRGPAARRIKAELNAMVKE